MALLAAAAPGGELRVQSVAPGELTVLDARIDALAARGTLVRKYEDREDPRVVGRRHERLVQVHRGLKVWGAEITRQRSPSGAVSIFGTIYEDLPALDVEPAVTADRARAIAGDRAGVATEYPPELLVYPLPDGRFALAWRVGVFDGEHLWVSFLDAHTGRELHRYDDYRTQTATVGLGTGVFGDRKKISVTLRDGQYYAADGLRPPLIVTEDAGGDVFRASTLQNRSRAPGLADAGVDADNVWTDGAVVDAHAYAGMTYDYYYKVHDRRGYDGADAPFRSIVNPARQEDFPRLGNGAFRNYFLNAGWNTFSRCVLYGVGAPTPVGGQRWSNLAGSSDVAAHELTHGVTQYSSDLIYFGESGALNEAFSDIMSTAIQFYFRTPSANYFIGDDVIVPGGIRSLVYPNAFGDPDHYSVRFLGTADNGGVHINASIVGHAYYLAVEGGSNRVSRLPVQGVGAAQREKIEKAFFRAFTRMLTPGSTFSDARAATLQSARDLYGSGDASVRALTEAWNAVGVN